MYWKYQIFFCFIFLCCFSGIYAQPIQKLRIDPAQAYGGTVSDYFSAVEYIPLETTKESLFGEIGNMIITNSSYIIQDDDTKSLLFFTKNGKLIKRHRYNANFSFFLNENIVKVVVFSQNQEEYTYNIYGKSIDKEKTIYKIDEYDMALTNGYVAKLISCYGKSKKTDNDTEYLISILNNKEKSTAPKNYLPISVKTLNQYKKTICDRLQLTATDKDYFLFTDFDFSIYKVDKDTALKIFELVFPADRTLPASIINNENPIDSRAIAMQYPATIRAITNIMLINKFLLLKLVPSNYYVVDGSGDLYQYNLMYHTKTNQLISYERIKPDKTNSFLPIGNGSRTSFKGLNSHNDNLYASVSSLYMFAAYEKNKSRKPQYPPVLQQYFKTQNRKSNPVIVRMKLKE